MKLTMIKINGIKIPQNDIRRFTATPVFEPEILYVSDSSIKYECELEYLLDRDADIAIKIEFYCYAKDLTTFEKDMIIENAFLLDVVRNESMDEAVKSLTEILEKIVC